VLDKFKFLFIVLIMGTSRLDLLTCSTITCKSLDIKIRCMESYVSTKKGIISIFVIIKSISLECLVTCTGMQKS
jgi:hypothetical protein